MDGGVADTARANATTALTPAVNIARPRRRVCKFFFFSNSVQFSYYINNRQPNGSLSNVLSRLAVGVRVDGDDETQRKEHEREGDQEETRHRVLACVPSEYR